jgi:hypothetical protein
VVLIALVLAVSSIAPVATARGAAEGIDELNALYDALLITNTPRLGFTSDREFRAVAHELPRRAEVEEHAETGSVEQLVKGVKKRRLVAALVHSRHGVAGDPALNVFSSGLITPRASLLRSNERGTAFADALNTAVITTIDAGTKQALQANFTPFESHDVPTCAINPLLWSFPSVPSEEDEPESTLRDAKARGYIRVGSVGPIDYGIAGNYTDLDHPTGFWPSYLDAILSHLSSRYGIGYKRVYYGNEWNVTAALEKGEVDITEPYFAVDSSHRTADGSVLPLYKAFETSCSVLGHQTVFVTYNPAGSARALERGAIVGIALAALVAGTALVFAIVLVSREKQGAPLFNPFQEDLSEGLLDRDVGAGGQAPNA